MVQQEAPQLHPFLRDVSVSFIPELTDDQLMRIERVISASHPDCLVSRMTDFTALIQGIRVEAETTHQADRVTWGLISHEVREVLETRADAGTQLTSIDVRLPAQRMFGLT